MRRQPLLLVLLVTAVSLGLAPAAPPLPASAPQSVVPVIVSIQCDGENIGEFWISRYTASLSKNAGDTVRFSLRGDSTVTSVQVEPKPGVTWPFVDAPPTFGRGNDAGSGSIQSDIAEGIYGYDLVATCGSSPDRIDPNMDIKR